MTTTPPRADRARRPGAAPTSDPSTHDRPAGGVPGTTPAVQVTGVTRRFGAVTALDGLDLEIPAGQVTCLLGPNGAGKSTLVDVLVGLGRPDTGRVEIFGRTPREAVRAGRIGAMLQNGALLPTLTVRECVQMVAGLHAHPMAVDDALALARAGDIATRRVEKLSGGQAQRARFAVAVVCDPDLLVLDEPTAAMDVSARRTFWAAMRRFTDRGRTVLFATHYLEEADEYADRVIVLRAGRIVADGTPTRIKAMAATRVVRAQVTDLPDASLEALPGVTAVTRRGDQVELRCADADVALRALLAASPIAHDVEVAGQNLETAFFALTEGTDR